MSLVINVNDTDHFDFLSATSQADLPETVTHLEVDVVGLKHGLLYKRRGVHGWSPLPVENFSLYHTAIGL